MTKSLEKESYIIPGTHKGLWSGYYLEIIYHNGNKPHPIKLEEGVNCKCEIIVDIDGSIYVK